MLARSQTSMPAGSPPSRGHLDLLSALRQVPALAAADSEQLVRISRHARLMSIARDRLVTVQGHPVDALYIVASGRFKRFRTSTGGREQILALLVPGDTFGEVPLLDGGDDFASTQAMQRSTVLAVPADLFRAVMAAESSSLADVCQTLTMRIRHMTGIIDDLSFRRVVERVAGLILQETCTPEQPRLTQATMAAMTGTTREVVARSIHELSDSGAIHVERGHISVRDLALLQHIATEGQR